MLATFVIQTARQAPGCSGMKRSIQQAPPFIWQVVAFRGTDSHSWYNWAENMRFWRSDFGLPFPGAEGALVHSGVMQAQIWSTAAAAGWAASEAWKRENAGRVKVGARGQGYGPGRGRNENLRWCSEQA